MAVNLNTNPYWDDFDGTKNYHHILFKPGTAVQSRELTQIQSVLKDQIKKFGDHIFKHGSVVIPGNSYADLNSSYVKINRTYLGESVDFIQMRGAELTNASSVRATVRHIEDRGDAFVVFYVSYTSGGTTGARSFSSGDTLQVVGGQQDAMTVVSDPSAIGVGSLAFVNAGVYYVNGVFGYVPRQSTVLSLYDTNPTCSVVLKISENIISANDDETLLDPAQGSYNFAAPGADRLQLLLTLDTIQSSEVSADNLIELMRYEEGVLLEHARTPKYSELEKSLAERTFDESGDYVVDGLMTNIREDRREGNNGGVNPDGSLDMLQVEVSAGKAYIKGFGVEKLSTNRVRISKGRTEDHIKTAQFTTRPRFGTYITVSDISGLFSVAAQQAITLWNTYDPTDVSATQIGSAKIVAIDYHAGDPSSTGIYRLYVSGFTLTGGHTSDSVGGVRWGSGSMRVVHQLTITGESTQFLADGVVSSVGGRTAKVRYHDTASKQIYVYKHDKTKDTPKSGDELLDANDVSVSVVSKNVLFLHGTPLAIFPVTKSPTKSLKTGDLWDTQYTVQKELSFTTDASGTGSVTISTGSILPVEIGTFFAIHSSGVVSNNLFSISDTGNTLSITGGPASTAIKVFCHVLKEAVAPKTKTLATKTETVTAAGNRITLSKYDAYRLVSVAQGGVDVTANFKLNSGQTDYRYELGYLTATAGVVSGDYEVTYQYFQHSITGDFFCVDSYAGNENYLDLGVFYGYNGVEINLLDTVDFRPAIGASSDLIVTDTQFDSSLRYFVPRIDGVVLSKSGVVSVVRGTPSVTPSVPQISDSQLLLDIVYIPPYTRSVGNVVAERMAISRYTMGDLKKIEERIDRLEEFATISSAEVETSQYEIIDAATGLNRFKTGYLVESFADPFILARVTHVDYNMTFIGGEMHAASESLECELRAIEYSHVIESGGCITLPFTEEAWINQPLSSRITNVNPFMVVAWNGQLSITPPSDFWVDVVEKPVILENKEEIVYVEVEVPCPRVDGGGSGPQPPKPDFFPIDIEPKTRTFSISDGFNNGTQNSSFSVKNVSNASVTVKVQEISRPSAGSTSISQTSFTLAAGESKQVGVVCNFPYGTTYTYNFAFAALAQGYETMPYPKHVVTLNRPTEPPKPPVLETEISGLGGWYGLLFGREGDKAGLDYWADVIKKVGVNDAASIFIKAAQENFKAGKEKTLNEKFLNPGTLIAASGASLSWKETKTYEVTKDAAGKVISKKPVSSKFTATRYDGTTYEA